MERNEDLEARMESQIEEWRNWIETFGMHYNMIPGFVCISVYCGPALIFHRFSEVSTNGRHSSSTYTRGASGTRNKPNNTWKAGDW